MSRRQFVDISVNAMLVCYEVILEISWVMRLYEICVATKWSV